MMYVAGVDIGSTTGKIVILDENRQLMASVVRYCSKGPEATANTVLDMALAQLPDAKLDDIAFVVGTGYGRKNISFIREDVSEVTCHAKGVVFLNPDVRTVIDIGGQDCKIMSVSQKGRVRDFAMNEKCAGGTGRFFEAMARVLDCSIDELAQQALMTDNPHLISNRCSVFAESEVISLLNTNVPIPEIAAGIHESIARRIYGMAYKIGIEEEVALTGGCSRNPALKKYLEKFLRTTLASFDIHPQLMGALGAALFAHEFAREGERNDTGNT